MFKLKSSLKKSTKGTLPPLSDERNHFYLQYTTPIKHLTTNSCDSLSKNLKVPVIPGTLPSTVNLEDWDAKHIKSSTSYWQNKVISKTDEMMNQASIFQISKKKDITNQFIRVSTRKSSTKVKQFMSEVENENAKVLNEMNKEKKKFNFNVFKQKRPSISDNENKILKTPFHYINSNESSLKYNGDSIFLFSPKKKPRKSIPITKMALKTEEESEEDNNDPNPITLSGALEHLINSEVEYQQMNKHKTEECFADELFKTAAKIRTRETEQQLLFDRINKLIKKLDDKQVKYSNSKDAIEIVSNENQNTVYTNKKSFEDSTRFLDKMKSAKDEIESFRFDYEHQLYYNQKTIPSIKYKLREIKSDIQSLKRLYKSMVKESINYYLSLLKSGLDVRGIGLSWIIAKLNELGAKVQKTDFPEWINQHSYNYLRSFTNKRIEIAKLNTLVSLIKKQYIKNGSTPKVTMETFETIKLKSSTVKKASTFLKELINEAKEQLHERNNSTLPNEQNEVITSEEIKKKINLIKNIIPTLEKVNMEQLDELNTTLLLTEEKVFKFFIGDNRDEKKNILDTLLYLNKMITKKEKEINQLKKDEITIFKNKYYNSKSKGTEECFNYDIIYFALFGNYSYI